MSKERFYMANLCADVSRCVSALLKNDMDAFEASRKRAWKTLNYLRGTTAFEEGLLMLAGLAVAHRNNTLDTFAQHVNRFALRHSPLGN